MGVHNVNNSETLQIRLLMDLQIHVLMDLNHKYGILKKMLQMSILIYIYGQRLCN